MGGKPTFAHPFLAFRRDMIEDAFPNRLQPILSIGTEITQAADPSIIASLCRMPLGSSVGVWRVALRKRNTCQLRPKSSEAACVLIPSMHDSIHA